MVALKLPTGRVDEEGRGTGWRWWRCCSSPSVPERSSSGTRSPTRVLRSTRPGWPAPREEREEAADAREALLGGPPAATTRRSTGHPGDHECATLTVPLDYADPEGDTIDLALLRVPAADRAAWACWWSTPVVPVHLGTDYAAAAGQVLRVPLLRALDVVGFDPRGTGESSPSTA